MPVYVWLCDACDSETETFQSIAHIDTPPDSCNSCSSPSFKNRVIRRPDNCKGFILADNGWGWPSHGFYATHYDKQTKEIKAKERNPEYGGSS